VSNPPPPNQQPIANTTQFRIRFLKAARTPIGYAKRGRILHRVKALLYGKPFLLEESRLEDFADKNQLQKIWSKCAKLSTINP